MQHIDIAPITPTHKNLIMYMYTGSGVSQPEQDGHQQWWWQRVSHLHRS